MSPATQLVLGQAVPPEDRTARAFVAPVNRILVRRPVGLETHECADELGAVQVASHATEIGPRPARAGPAARSAG
jgi:hypothetical protein